MAKSALMTTAYQEVMKEDGTTAADPFDMGAGHITPNSAVDPGLVYDAGLFEYAAFTCGKIWVSLRLEAALSSQGLVSHSIPVILTWLRSELHNWLVPRQSYAP